MLFTSSVKKIINHWFQKFFEWHFGHVYIFVHNTEDEEDSEILDLLVTTPGSVDKENLQLYFEQFTEQFELAKHGNNSWILKLCSQSGMIYESFFSSATEISQGDVKQTGFAGLFTVHHLHMMQA